MSVLGGVKASRSDSPPPGEQGIQSASMARNYSRGPREPAGSRVLADPAKNKMQCRLEEVES